MRNSKCMETGSKTYCKSWWKKHLCLAYWEAKGNKKGMMGDTGRREMMRELWKEKIKKSGESSSMRRRSNL